MMTGPLSPRIHGFFDYGTSVLLALAPSLFGFSGLPAAVCYVLAVGLFAISLVTAYPLSVAKLVPFTVHGAIEAVIAPLLLVAPWLLRFSDVVSARNFFLVAGVGLGLLFLVTNYRAAERPNFPAARRQRSV